MAEGVTVDPSGRILVAEVGKRRIVAIDPDTGALSPLITNAPIGLPAPEGFPPSFIPTGIAAGRDGSIYFSSDIENTIYHLVPN